jgi:hypothetical protein
VINTIKSLRKIIYAYANTRDWILLFLSRILDKDPLIFIADPGSRILLFLSRIRDPTSGSSYFYSGSGSSYIFIADPGSAYFYGGSREILTFVSYPLQNYSLIFCTRNTFPAFICAIKNKHSGGIYYIYLISQLKS